MTGPDRELRHQIIREAIREARAARREDTRTCRCSHPASGHVVRLSDGEAFNCLEEGCGCKKFAETTATAREDQT